MELSELLPVLDAKGCTPKWSRWHIVNFNSPEVTLTTFSEDLLFLRTKAFKQEYSAFLVAMMGPQRSVRLLKYELAGLTSLGFTTNEVRQSLGHHNKAFQRGINEGYAGSPMREFYNDRAKREFVHPWGAKFSEQSALELIKSPVTEEEIRDWQDRNEPLE
ncbi:hypothetical protein V1504DRAFT_484206, partial [Lipomyces starkeyi]